ncbi:hypothetical protein K709_0635 [Campylobacter coli HN-CCD07046]|nr:hypothetical protein K709_0635 [Campylobacter coli HN-CCD07046]
MKLHFFSFINFETDILAKNTNSKVNFKSLLKNYKTKPNCYQAKDYI